jgi:hypothetical protein
MQHNFETPPEEQAVTAPALDSNDVLFIKRAQLKREEQAIKSQLKAVDEDIRDRIQDGERFADETTELYLLPVETTTFDWKAAVTAGLFTQEQAQPFLKRTLPTQLRTRKVEPVTTYAEGTAEADDLRKRLDNASARLTG